MRCWTGSLFYSWHGGPWYHYFLPVFIDDTKTHQREWNGDRMEVGGGAQAWNMIRPLSWIEVLSCQKMWERDGGRKTEEHCIHILSPTSLRMPSLCPCHCEGSIVWMYEHLFMAHMLYKKKKKKKKKIFVGLAEGKCCPLSSCVRLYKQMFQDELWDPHDGLSKARRISTLDVVSV